ncbi:MAG: methyltransferase domain-containing protein [Nanoarchaeota archaeon]
MKGRTNPKSILSAFAYLIPKKEFALDLGCGYGPNSFFLLEQGLDVVAVDSSSEKLSYLQEKAKPFFNRLQIISCDLREFTFTRNFGAIICTDVLHFLPKEKGIQIVQSMKKHTILGGINFISTFLPKGDLYKSKLVFFNFGELKALYSGWDIIFYEEKMKLTYKWNGEKEDKRHEVASIVARRIE